MKKVIDSELVVGKSYYDIDNAENGALLTFIGEGVRTINFKYHPDNTNQCYFPDPKTGIIEFQKNDYFHWYEKK